jgi:putative transposase
VFALVSEKETEELARETGYYQRAPQQLPAFEFALCCALAAVCEHKRGFASVWRLLATAAGIEVARSAVTQRFGPGSASLLEELFFRAVQRLPSAGDLVLRERLNAFRDVLAQDGTVLQLSPVLATLFPATRTNVVDAAAKVHVTADLRARRIIDVTVTGERGSELDELYLQEFIADTLYLFDLGYTSYDLLSTIDRARAFVLMRLKENANPTVVRVRQGVRAPQRSVGCKFKDLEFCKTQDRFDLDAEFVCAEFQETVTMRVVGLWNPQTQRYHCYVTNLAPEQWGVEELVTLYRQRWIIELLMKLMKSHCHLDHLDTGSPEALRTQLYASLLAAVVLHAVTATAASSARIPLEEISFLTVGIAAPLLAVTLLMLWLGRKVTCEELATMIFRTIAFGCRDQNRGRTRESTAPLR